MTTIVIIAIALFFFVLSYLMWARKLLFIIADIPRKSPNKHERQMAKDGGILTFVCGLLTCILIYFQDNVMMFVLYGIVIFIICLCYIMRATTYTQ